MNNTVLRFSFVLIVMLLLLSMPVYAKGRPTITYSWSVAISGENLQPVDNSTYTVTTTQSSSTFSQLRFEALSASGVKLVGISPLQCLSGDCAQISSAIRPENGDTIQQPDGTKYNRVEFVVHLNGVDFANMSEGSSVEKNLSGSDGLFFWIDPSDPSENNYIYGELWGGTITITRDTSSNTSSTWSITCNSSTILLKELEGHTETRCRGKSCTSTVLYFTEVARGTAGPMVFDLKYTRLAH